VNPLVIFAFRPAPKALVELFRTVRGVNDQARFKVLLQGAKPVLDFSFTPSADLIRPTSILRFNFGSASCRTYELTTDSGCKIPGRDEFGLGKKIIPARSCWAYPLLTGLRNCDERLSSQLAMGQACTVGKRERGLGSFIWGLAEGVLTRWRFWEPRQSQVKPNLNAARCSEQARTLFRRRPLSP
jgi:hypothetical protein